MIKTKKYKNINNRLNNYRINFKNKTNNNKINLKSKS